MNERDPEILLARIEELENEICELRGRIVKQEAGRRSFDYRRFNLKIIENFIKNNDFLYENLVRLRSWLQR